MKQTNPLSDCNTLPTDQEYMRQLAAERKSRISTPLGKKAELDQQIHVWTTEPPGYKCHSPLSALHIARSICTGQGNCRVSDICGNLLGVICTGECNKYFIVDKSSKEVISQCAETAYSNCRSFVPKEWTCGSPKNMPLSQSDPANKGYDGVVSCGDVLGINDGTGGDGPYFFESKSTGEKLLICGPARSTCKLPPEWTCEWPSNY
jgi:hypothetical protein